MLFVMVKTLKSFEDQYYLVCETRKGNFCGLAGLIDLVDGFGGD